MENKLDRGSRGLDFGTPDVEQGGQLAQGTFSVDHCFLTARYCLVGLFELETHNLFELSWNKHLKLYVQLY